MNPFQNHLYQLQSLINGSLMINVGDLHFEGLKLARNEKYPWKNKKEMNKYCNDLEEIHTPESYKEYVGLENQMMLEDIHVRASWAFISLTTGYILAFSALIMFLINFRLQSLMVFTTGLLFLGLFFLFRHFLKKSYFNRELFLGFWGEQETWMFD